MPDYRRCPACDVSWFGDDKACFVCGEISVVGYIHIEVSLSVAHEKCWADRPLERCDWDDDVRTKPCQEKAVTRLGLCEEHHAEIVPQPLLVST